MNQPTVKKRGRPSYASAVRLSVGGVSTHGRSGLIAKRLRRASFSEQHLHMALRRHRSGLSLRKAAAGTGVPLATLIGYTQIWKMSGHSDATLPLLAPLGRSTLLPPSAERDLADWLRKLQALQQCAFPKCVRQKATLLARHYGYTGDELGTKWLTGFIERHPDLSIKKGELLTSKWSVCMLAALTDTLALSRYLRHFIQVTGRAP